MNGLLIIILKYSYSYHTNKDKSSLTSLVACFILGKIYLGQNLLKMIACGIKENPPVGRVEFDILFFSGSRNLIVNDGRVKKVIGSYNFIFFPAKCVVN